ncbi:hypothetical protein GCM10010442_13540 [Kitasatospora kifunensis]
MVTRASFATFVARAGEFRIRKLSRIRKPYCRWRPEEKGQKKFPSDREMANKYGCGPGGPRNIAAAGAGVGTEVDGIGAAGEGVVCMTGGTYGMPD